MQQQLYDGLIHVHNRSLHDYGTPLLELLLYLRAHLIAKTTKTLPSETLSVGCKVPYFESIVTGLVNVHIHVEIEQAHVMFAPTAH